MSKIEQMFDFKGKTTKIIGSSRTQAYKTIYNHITEKQKAKELSTHSNYLLFIINSYIYKFCIAKWNFRNSIKEYFV